MTAIFALLLLGHALGDFVFQSGALVERKRQPGTRVRGLLEHAAILVLCHGAAAWPVLSANAMVSIVLLVAVHLVIDAVKSLADARTERHLACFLADQLAHLATIWFFAHQWGSIPNLASAEPWWQIDAATIAIISQAYLYAFAWILSSRGGGFVVAMMLNSCRFGDLGLGDSGPPLGRTIGTLERLLIVTLVIAEAWAGIGLILAAKSVARFKELESRAFSEYYLVGTLTSVLVAVIVGLGIGTLLAQLAVNPS
ncbi:MAG: DUF3307 domain-containing protein [bacterium]|nr:DUF3307 domain-containing protein [bacterium]